MKANIIYLVFLWQFAVLFAGATNPTHGSVSFPCTGFGSTYYPILLPDGSYVLAGSWWQVPNSVYRIDANGQTIWAKRLESFLDYRLNDVVVTSDTGICLLYNKKEDEILLIKLDINGNVKWTNQFDFTGGRPFTPTILKPQSGGGVVFAISFDDDMAAVKINGNGSIASSVIVSDTVVNTGFAAFDAEGTPSGDIIITGSLGDNPIIMRIDSNATIAWTIDFIDSAFNQSHSIVPTYDGNYLVGGVMMHTANGSFLMKISPAGTALWRKFYNSGAPNQPGMDFMHVIENADGTILGAGTWTDNVNPVFYDAYAQLSSTGQILHAWAIPGGIEHKQPKFFTGPYGETFVSGMLYDLASSQLIPAIINSKDIGSVCQATTPPISETILNTYNVTGINFLLHTAPTPTHPDIAAVDDAVQFCGVSDICLTSPTDIREVNPAPEISLLPNPVLSSKSLVVKCSTPFSDLVIFDVSGRIIRNLTIENTSETAISTTGLAAGLYVVELQNQVHQKIGVKPMIVE